MNRNGIKGAKKMSTKKSRQKVSKKGTIEKG